MRNWTPHATYVVHAVSHMTDYECIHPFTRKYVSLCVYAKPCFLVRDPEQVSNILNLYPKHQFVWDLIRMNIEYVTL